MDLKIKSAFEMSVDVSFVDQKEVGGNVERSLFLFFLKTSMWWHRCFYSMLSLIGSLDKCFFVDQQFVIPFNASNNQIILKRNGKTARRVSKTKNVVCLKNRNLVHFCVPSLMKFLDLRFPLLLTNSHISFKDTWVKSRTCFRLSDGDTD